MSNRSKAKEKEIRARPCREVEDEGGRKSDKAKTWVGSAEGRRKRGFEGDEEDATGQEGRGDVSGDDEGRVGVLYKY